MNGAQGTAINQNGYESIGSIVFGDARHCPGNYDSLDLRPRRLGPSTRWMELWSSGDGNDPPAMQVAIVSPLRNALNIN